MIESSGKFRTVAPLEPYFERAVRKVVVAAPVKDAEVLNVVMGCNDHLYDPDVHGIVTAASCTTNCLAPVVKVLHEAIGIERGVITTIHDVTNTQVIVDAPHKDLRRARSALNSLIPTSTGSATAIILGFEDRPLVSADYTNDTRSGIVDGPTTMVVDGRMVKVLVWYDNEYGYVHRMAELAAKVAASLDDGVRG